MSKIRTVNQLVEVLGGTAEMARALNVTPQYISKMKRQGFVPATQILKVQDIAKRKRWKISNALFEVGNNVD